MLRTIYLHGSLAAFGESFRLDVRDAGEACRALGCQLPGFRETIEDGNWHVFRGPLDAENDLSRDDVHMGLGKASEIHIMPAAEGAGGAFKAVLGLLLLGPQNAIAAFTTPLDSLTSMLSPTPQTDSYSDRERPGERPSFLFDGPTNTSTQGLPVPLIYGRMRVGSIVVSADLSADDIALGSDYEPDDPVAT
jgi:predicted phage tail protein